jgi:hypothetical protein
VEEGNRERVPGRFLRLVWVWFGIRVGEVVVDSNSCWVTEGFDWGLLT